MYNKLGPDTGFDSIGEFTTAKAMSHFLNELNMEGKLTRTILYTLNPCANEVIATMLGNFQDGSCPGKIQFGSGWWFNDQLDGISCGTRHEDRARIGNRIKEIREERGIEARDLSRLVGIDAANLSRIENGRYSVGLDILAKIATALGKKVDFVDIDQ